MEIPYTVHIFKEDGVFVAHVPELDVSSCGDSDQQVRQNIRDAVQGFLDASADRGTLADILQEAGYARHADGWRPPEFVGIDRLTARVG